MCIAQQVKLMFVFFHPKYFFSPKNTANLFASSASLHRMLVLSVIWDLWRMRVITKSNCLQGIKGEVQ